MAQFQAPAFETFLAYARLAGFDDDNMIRDIYQAADPFFADGVSAGDILDLMAASGTAPKSYQDYISKFNIIKQGTTGITTVREWNQSRAVYRNLLKQYGLSELATNDNADQFLLNDVSPQEAADRMQVAYNSVRNADEALKQQLKTYFPSVSDKDLVANILGVGKTVQELQQQINVAGIKAEAATAGISSVIGAEELAKQGVTREAARAGFQKTAQEVSGLSAAGMRAGIDVNQLQKELEQENLLGMASARRKKIQQAEANLFSGAAGVGTPSLGSGAAGTF